MEGHGDRPLIVGPLTDGNSRTFFEEGADEALTETTDTSAKIPTSAIFLSM